ncbi:MAG: hypothetical protein P8L85_06880 [Rubripirellula sp.]|nr:hypothetical protein [Rubripirellula sp.]
MIDWFVVCTRPLKCGMTGRAVLLLMSSVICVSAVQAQEAVSPKRPVESAPAAETEVAETVDKTEVAESERPNVFLLSPRSQPDPMLRYRLWPAVELRKRGNPAALVSRALLLAATVSPETKKQFAESSSEWSDLSLEQLPVEQVQKLLSSYSFALNELRRAENLFGIEYDLHLEGSSATEMLQTLLPELQEMRQLARLLQLQARLAIAQGRWDDAVRDLRVGFRLAEFAGHSTEFMIGRLVGLAISGVMMNVVEEAIEQPDCPNLYWALSGLPSERLFDTKQALEFETVLLALLFDVGDPLPDTPIGANAARVKIARLIENASEGFGVLESDEGQAAGMQLTAGLYVVSATEPSRELLAETKQWAGRVDQLSSSEAVLRASLLKFNRIRDKWLAWLSLPAEFWDDYAEQRQAALDDFESNGDLLFQMMTAFMPSLDAAHNAGLRARQQHHLLLSIEAIRMHAGQTGELPESLELLKPVPAWRDAITGKPFEYTRASLTESVLRRGPRFSGDEESTFQLRLRGTP